MFKGYIFIVLLTKCALSQVNFSSISCTQRSPKIIGGLHAEKHEMPFIVSLTRRGGHFCGATIIGERWLLTAGHCICNGLNKFMQPVQIQGVVGLHNISTYIDGKTDENDLGPAEVYFKSISPHPYYRCTSVKDDIALLELVKPLKFTSHIQPICLDGNIGLKHHENELATVSGWGWTHENQEVGHRSDVLKKADVKIWNTNICEKSYQANGKPNHVLSDTQLCAGFEAGGVDSCWADSGGPLMSKDNFLIGVVSTGIGCGRPGLPGIYTRVSKYIKWIESVIFSKTKY